MDSRGLMAGQRGRPRDTKVSAVDPSPASTRAARLATACMHRDIQSLVHRTETTVARSRMNN
jgi:hypothetical protein